MKKNGNLLIRLSIISLLLINSCQYGNKISKTEKVVNEVADKFEEKLTFQADLGNQEDVLTIKLKSDNNDPFKYGLIIENIIIELNKIDISYNMYKLRDKYGIIGFNANDFDLIKSKKELFNKVLIKLINNKIMEEYDNFDKNLQLSDEISKLSQYIFVDNEADFCYEGFLFGSSTDNNKYIVFKTKSKRVEILVAIGLNKKDNKIYGISVN
jgi:hypothetical protein